MRAASGNKLPGGFKCVFTQYLADLCTVLLLDYSLINKRVNHRDVKNFKEINQ